MKSLRWTLIVLALILCVSPGAVVLVEAGSKKSVAPSSSKRAIKSSQEQTKDFLEQLNAKYSHQPAFLQAVQEVTESLQPLFDDPINGDSYRKALRSMTEPERIISFKVTWEDDQGVMQCNRGWRVEFSR